MAGPDEGFLEDTEGQRKPGGESRGGKQWRSSERPSQRAGAGNDPITGEGDDQDGSTNTGPVIEADVDRFHPERARRTGGEGSNRVEGGLWSRTIKDAAEGEGPDADHRQEAEAAEGDR